MDDLTWLAGRTIIFAADSPLLDDAPQPAPSAVVADPTRVQAYTARGLNVIAVAGYPTGRHHTLVKAAEARLAIQSGAGEVWVCVDSLVHDRNALLADLVAMRDACPAPARMGLMVQAASASVEMLKELAAQAGYDRLILRAKEGYQLPVGGPLEIVVLSPGATTEEIIARLEAGAAYVAV